MAEGRKIRKVYGQVSTEEYDNYLFGLIPSRADKKKAKQEHTQRNANIALTHQQGAKTAAEAEAARFDAKAAQARAAAAERLAAMTTIQLQGAKATTQLKNASLVTYAMLILGVIGVGVLIAREFKKAAQLQADQLQQQVVPNS